ncbi:MAG: 4-alpha-glucanotransferase, partial [Candidatus Eremiobacterota bacterium]
EEEGWLEDFALFMALKAANGGTAWNEWDPLLRHRDPEALRRARHAHAQVLHGHRFIQWLFFRSWENLKRHANERNIRVIGDIPIFVAMDSCDTWVAPRCFHLDKKARPTVVAGVPPDYFSPDGQLWGNPLYRWREMKQDGFSWWLERIRAAFRLYDYVRIDHFRGFAAYWEVSGKAATARKGRWVKAPGVDLFKRVRQVLGDLAIIAEDLGVITPDVESLRDRFGFPGMKVLQFGFGSDARDKFLPHNYEANFVAYSGTHDNDTSLGWYETARPEEQDFCRRYFASDGTRISHAMVRGVFASVARMAVVPLQDVLELGTEARMNFPGRRHDNWLWRYLPGDLTEERADFLRDLARTYGRI